MNQQLIYAMVASRKMKNGNLPGDFFQQVYAVVELIPYGRVTSYGAIAKYLGTAKSSRMVGWALNNSHSSTLKLPAHRVVNRIGLLTGKANFNDPGLMQHLLESEGVKIENDKVLNFDTLFWDPFLLDKESF